MDSFLLDMNPFQRSHRRRAAFSDLVRAHGGAMVVLARRLIGLEEAEDVVQTALASAWKHFEVQGTLAEPRRWLLRFVGHECANIVGRRMRRPATVEFESGDEERAGHVGDIVSILEKELAWSAARDPRAMLEFVEEGLSRAVRSLGEAERTTLMLRAVGELSYKEISEDMGVPIGTVMSRLCRAREKLRVELERTSGGARSAAASADAAEGQPADRTAR